jgi:hypothetical protein
MVFALKGDPFGSACHTTHAQGLPEQLSGEQQVTGRPPGCGFSPQHALTSDSSIGTAAAVALAALAADKPSIRTEAAVSVDRELATEPLQMLGNVHEQRA